MKLIVFKKSLIITVIAIIFSGAALGLCAGALAATNSHDGERTIVIDAGHGGVDAGVSGVQSKIKESDINLAVAKRLKGYFSDAGFNVIMTRKNNGGLYGFPTDGFKARDMKKRRSIIEESGAEMVISIHQNFCSAPSRRGGQVFYDKNSQGSKLLAECIQSELNSMPECVKKTSALTGDYYMLKCTDSPSVIVECGFLSNVEDETLLSSPDYQGKIAYAIFKGAVSFYG